MGRRDSRPNGRKRTTGKKLERKYSLSAEAVERLELHAYGTGRRPAEVLEELILANCRRFFLTDRGGDGEPAPT